MTRPRISMRALLFAVLLIAADCAIIRLGIAAMTGGIGLVFGLFGVLPMANLLAIGAYRLVSRRAAGRRFLIGFELSGLVVILVLFNLCLMIDEKWLLSYDSWMIDKVDNSLIGQYVQRHAKDGYARSISQGIGVLAFYTSLTAPPQLLASLLGGWVVHRIARASGPAASG